MKLSTLATRVSRTVVTVGDGAELWVDFRPQAITPELIALVAAAEQSGDAGEIVRSLSATLCAVVAGWDLQEDDGEMVPLTVERLGTIPVAVLYAVLNGTREAVSVGEAKPAASDVG